MKTEEKINTQRIVNPLRPDTAKRLYTVKEAAIYLGKSVWAMRQLVYAGKIKVVKDGDKSKPGKLIFIDRLDLDGYIESHKEVYN